MGLKAYASDWSIKEQTIEDPVSMLTFQFERLPTGEMCFRVFGNLPSGNRQFVFNDDGEEAGAGPIRTGLSRPAREMAQV